MCKPLRFNAKVHHFRVARRTLTCRRRRASGRARWLGRSVSLARCFGPARIVESLEALARGGIVWAEREMEASRQRFPARCAQRRYPDARRRMRDSPLGVVELPAALAGMRCAGIRQVGN